MKLYGLEKIEDKNQRLMFEQWARVSDINYAYGTDEFMIVMNPSGIYPPFDFYPLAGKLTSPLKKISAILCDMDGTTTTTETLCLYSLEYMIKSITADENKNSIKSLDHSKDYPHIIGNSTTKHVEYLIKTYNHAINAKSFCKAYLFSVVWTLLYSKDEGRKDEVIHTIKALGIDKPILEKIHAIISGNIKNIDPVLNAEDLLYLDVNTKVLPFPLQVKMAVDIYYQKYHEILSQIAEGRGEELSKKLVQGKNLIEPMPHISLFLSLVKGYLGKDAQLLAENSKQSSILVQLGEYFEKHPVKIAIVTSSIFYEANIVLKEVFKVIQSEMKKWPVSSDKKKKLLSFFSDYHNIYDTIITASDSNEIRLKPHRDLYSIALYKLGIPVEEFNTVIGLEDSESGISAIRAAGIGRSIGVPFDATKGHNLKAAALVLEHGLTDLIFKLNIFLDSIH